MSEAHADLSCFDCHDGSAGKGEKESAHADLVEDPSDADAAGNVCANCHSRRASDFEKSVHYTLSGYLTTFEARSGLPATDANFQAAFQARCEGCHTSCGQCHISRPNSVKGGLVEEHEFLATPRQNDQCTACHGSRINDEYKGVHPGLQADVHYINGMLCFDCHSGGELHGGGTTPATRRDVFGAPACADCHPGPAAGDDGLTHHELHVDRVDCPVCHAQPYRNCYQCHVGEGGGKSHGLQFPSELDFRIGKNPIRNDIRPWNYVLLRHIPVYPEMYEAYGISSLATFDNLPTWKYATPHNIRRTTPQTASCNGCHMEQGLYLTASYLDSLVARGVGVDEETTANASVVANPPASPGPGPRRK